RPERNRTRRLGRVPRHRRGALDEYFGPAHHHVRVARGRARGLAVAPLTRAVPVLSGAQRSTDRRNSSGHRLRGVQRLGRTVAAHHLDAGHGESAALVGPTLAVAAGLAAGLRRGAGAGPLGLSAGGLLAQL